MTLSHAATKSRTNFSLRVVARVDFRDGAELGVRTEDEVDAAAGPLDLARLAVAALEGLRGSGRRPPLRAHVEQVHEEVVGQRPGPLGEDAELGLPDVRVQDAQPADEHGHLGSGQRQQVRPIDQQMLRPGTGVPCPR